VTACQSWFPFVICDRSVPVMAWSDRVAERVMMIPREGSRFKRALPEPQERRAKEPCRCSPLCVQLFPPARAATMRVATRMRVDETRMMRDGVCGHRVGTRRAVRAGSSSRHRVHGWRARQKNAPISKENAARGCAGPAVASSRRFSTAYPCIKVYTVHARNPSRGASRRDRLHRSSPLPSSWWFRASIASAQASNAAATQA
jgi:hypothetical protein